jgi:hypothetical protein
MRHVTSPNADGCRGPPIGLLAPQLLAGLGRLAPAADAHVRKVRLPISRRNNFFHAGRIISFSIVAALKSLLTLRSFLLFSSYLKF